MTDHGELLGRGGPLNSLPEVWAEVWNALRLLNVLAYLVPLGDIRLVFFPSSDADIVHDEATLLTFGLIHRH